MSRDFIQFITLPNKNKELEEISNLNDIRQSIEELKENVIKHILEENKRLRDRIIILDESYAKQNKKPKLHENSQLLRKT